MRDQTGREVANQSKVPPEDDFLSVNCGRCGKQMLVRVEEVRELRIIDCPACAKGESGYGARRLLPFVKSSTG